MSIIQKLQWRYATKKFDAHKTLSTAQITTLKQAFNLTALSYGLQILKLVVVENKALREELVGLAYGQRQVVDASHLLVICVQDVIDANDVETHFESVKAIRNTPDAILNPFKEDLKTTVEGMTAEKKISWATKQAYIALGNLMTVCAVEEIDSCPMEGFMPEALDEKLNLKAHGLRSVLLLPVGFRADDDLFSSLKKVRQPVSKTVIEL